MLVEGERAFAVDSNVGRYWLARAQGFTVVAARGRRVGVVKDLVVDPQTLEVSSVLVRRRPGSWARRTARLPVGELRTVLPGSRRFVLVPKEGPARTRVWATVAGRQGAVAARRTGEVSAIAARHTGHASAVAARHTGHASAVAARHTGHASAVAARRTGRALATGSAVVAAETRARWPGIRHDISTAAARTGRWLSAAAAGTATFLHAAWRWAGARLREGELYVRSRARRSYSPVEEPARDSDSPPPE
jgi:sporulation protein YlmC with PRC-barrel domain